MSIERAELHSPLDATAAVPGRVSSATRTAVEVVAVVLLSGIWFFWGTGAGDFVGTEGLRAVIAKEMLGNEDWLIPTVHQRVYLRKPPLYAWTTAAVARIVGRLDEQVSRWPSAALSVAYVLMMYLAARWLVDPLAGPAGAVIAAANWFVLDYGMRADLDAGVLFFLGLAVLLIGRAWVHPGAGRWWLVALGYLAAVAGSFWKAPHVLVCVWLTLAALVLMDRRASAPSAWRLVRHPLHLVIAGAALLVVLAWYALLGQEAGAGRVAGFTALEFLARLFPRNVGNLLAILNGPLEFLYVALPMNLFAGVLLLRSAAADRQAMEPRRWRLVVAWLLANIALLLVVPAKAPRYWFTCLPPLVILATLVWRRYVHGQLAPTAQRFTSAITCGVLVVLAAGGVSFIVAGSMLATGTLEIEGLALKPARIALFAGGALMAATALLGCFALRQDQRTVAGAMIVLALVIFKVPHVYALLPFISSVNSLRPTARQIAARVPPSHPIYVFSEREWSDRSGEVADLGWYTNREIRWPRDEGDFDHHVATGPGYVLVRRSARERLLERHPDATELETYDWPDGPLHLFEVMPPR